MRTRRGDASGPGNSGDETEKGCVCGETHPEIELPEDGVEHSPSKRGGRGVKALPQETFWLQCDGPCRSWYHVLSQCVGFPSTTAASAKKLPSWTCVECVEKEKEKASASGTYTPPICRSTEEVDLYTPCYPLVVALNYPLWYSEQKRVAAEDDGGTNAKTANGEGICVCGLSHDPDKHTGSNALFWLQCDGCQSWFNNSVRCIGLTEVEAQMLDRWICKGCCSGTSTTDEAALGSSRPMKKAKVEEFHPGHICNDAVFYCTLDDETCADVAKKLGCNWRNVAIANKARYGRIKPDSRFEQRTLLLLPKKIDPETIAALQIAKARDPREEQEAENKEEVTSEYGEEPAPTFITAKELNVKPGKADSTGQYYCTLDDESCAIVAQKLGCDWQDLAGINRERYGRITAKARFEKGTVLTIPSDHEAFLVARLGGKAAAAVAAVPVVSQSPTAQPTSANLRDKADASGNVDDDAGVSDKQNETFYPGYVCKDMLYYCTLDNETVRKCASKLGCQCKDLIDLNKGTYKGLKASSELQEGTILQIPIAQTAAAIKKLEALYHYEDKLDFCCECFLIEKRGEPMLLCDGCDAACHLPCAFPGLTEAPEGDWFCKKCIEGKEKVEADKEE